MQPVTPRQLDILKYIRDFRLTNGFSPTMQEIGDHLGLTKVTVFEHVAALEKKDLLLRGEKHRARSLQVSDEVTFEDETGAKLPLLGRIAAGAPIEAIENAESLDLTDVFPTAAGSNTFVLEVQGDSMINAHICDGDYVICQKRNTARNGDIVIALLEDGDATLKTLYKEKGHIRLQPENDDYEPLLLKPEQLQIQGVMIGLIRK